MGIIAPHLTFPPHYANLKAISRQNKRSDGESTYPEALQRISHAVLMQPMETISRRQTAVQAERDRVKECGIWLPSSAPS